MPGDDRLGVAVLLEHSMTEQQRARTEHTNRLHGVADDEDRRSGGLELAHPVEALGLKREVADGEHLVNKQHARLDVNGDGESEPHEHARRVELHRCVDEVRQLGEGNDVVEALVDCSLCKAEQHAVDVDVLAAGHLLRGTRRRRR